MMAAFVPGAFSAAPRAVLAHARQQPCALQPRGPKAGLLQAGGASLAAGVAAFVCGRRQHRVAQVAARAGWQPDAERIGATLPLVDPKDGGALMWDPVGFCKDGRQETFDRYRAAEVKHGRVAMVAVVGLVVQHFLHIKNFVTIDGFISMDTMPNGIGAISQEPGGQVCGLIVLIAGFFELSLLRAPEGAKPWEFGDPLGWRKQVDYLGLDDDMLKTYEIEHGRLAMFGFIGVIAAEYATGYDAVEQWGNWAVGLREFNRFTK